MFRLYGNGRDQARTHRCRAVSGSILSVSALFFLFKSSVIASSHICPPELQVQEAHRLQEEETAAADKEAAVPPPPSDVTHRQLRARRLEVLKRRASFLIRVPVRPRPVSAPRFDFSGQMSVQISQVTNQFQLSLVFRSSLKQECWTHWDVRPHKRPHTCVFWINNTIIATVCPIRGFSFMFIHCRSDQFF